MFEIDLGTVRVGALERGGRFKRARAALAGSDVLPGTELSITAGPRLLITARATDRDGEEAQAHDLHAEAGEATAATLHFEVSGLPLLRDLRLVWRHEPDVETNRVAGLSGGVTLKLRVVRTVPMWPLAVATVPLMFLLRHAVGTYRPGLSAIVPTVPVLGALVDAGLNVFKPDTFLKRRPRFLLAVAWMGVCLLAYGALRRLHPFAAILSQDDTRTFGGARQEAGNVRFLWAPSLEGDPGDRGCVWAAGRARHCFSQQLPLAPGDRIADALDDAFGTPVTRARCSSDTASFAEQGVVNGPDTCAPAKASALSTRPVLGPCSAQVRFSDDGDCKLLQGPVDAWLAFPAFLATARPRPAQRGAPARVASLVCDEQAQPAWCRPAGGTDGFSIARDHDLALELSELCPEREDSICAIRSRGPVPIEHVPLPLETPVHVTTEDGEGTRAASQCTIHERAPRLLRLEVLDGAAWIQTVTVTAADGSPLTRCSPAGDSSRLAVLLPDAPVADYGVTVTATHEPDSKTILFLWNKLAVTLDGDLAQSWTSTVNEPGRHFARRTKIDACASSETPSTWRTARMLLTGASASGRVDSLFLVSRQGAASVDVTGSLDEGRRCGTLPDLLDTLPAAAHCALAPHVDDYGDIHWNQRRPAPWCPR